MRDWQLLVAVDPGDEQPLFLQISRQLVEAILDGRLTSGTALPGSRRLAAELGVHRNTVLAAYDELSGEGWITATPARGTFVAENLSRLPLVPARPGQAAAPRAGEAPVGFPVPDPMPLVDPPGYQAGRLVLSRGAPDVRLFPRADLARAYRHVLDRSGAADLAYAEPRGHLGLRTALAEMLASQRGLPGGPETIMVTRGSQMAIQLLVRGLLQPGDAVAMESLSSPHSFGAVRDAGMRVVPIPLDDKGMRIDLLAERAARGDLRAVYVTPHHQFPTTSVMPSARRLALLDVAREHRLLVIEDDYDHEYHFEGRPVKPLASLDPGGNVAYVGTLSKVLAPGLRIGYVRTAPEVVERLVSIRALMDIQGDHLLEAALAEMFEAGDIGRHLRRMGRVNRERRDALLRAIAEHLPDVLTAERPVGGMAVWAQVDPAVDLIEWSRRGEAAGVSFMPGGIFSVDGSPVSATRLGFSLHSEAELTEAVRRMRRALP